MPQHPRNTDQDFDLWICAPAALGAGILLVTGAGAVHDLITTGAVHPDRGDTALWGALLLAIGAILILVTKPKFWRD